MAITNFAHMKPWERMYEKILVLEDHICEPKNKESYIQVVLNSRGVIDLLTKKLIEENGITDKQIREVAEKKGKGDSNRITLYKRILALEDLDCISRESASKLHFLRNNGNMGDHGEEYFIEQPIEKLKKTAEEMYSALYRETYLFANQYIPEAKSRKSTRVTTGANSSGKVAASGGDRKVASGPSSTNIILAAVKIFFVLLVTVIMIAMIMNFPF